MAQWEYENKACSMLLWTLKLADHFSRDPRKGWCGQQGSVQDWGLALTPVHTGSHTPYLARPAITRYHKQGSLNQHVFVVSRFWRWKSKIQGPTGPTHPLRVLPCLPLAFGVATNPWCSWVCRGFPPLCLCPRIVSPLCVSASVSPLLLRTLVTLD